MSIGDTTVHTAPLTAGGLTVLQILQTLQALQWPAMAGSQLRSAYLVEAARAAWNDRLTLLGDPDFVSVPQEKLLSVDYAEETAKRVREAVAKGQPIGYAISARTQPGTIHLSAADRAGNFAALTLTHGGSFGAQVTVEGLGLTLGHGMSRFDPHADHPNAPGPGKRPLNNMVPTILTREGQAIMAVGGRGGRKIPNSVLSFLAARLFEQGDLANCLAAPRMHTEGDRTLEVQPTWAKDDQARLSAFGYQVKEASMATLSAVAVADRQLVSGMR
jgi:gamma-glutamyltranspeptidase/glutathione hydrolase